MLNGGWKVTEAGRCHHKGCAAKKQGRTSPACPPWKAERALLLMHAVLCQPTAAAPPLSKSRLAHRSAGRRTGGS